MNFAQLRYAIISYSENEEERFIENIPLFIEQAEQRIYNSVQLPALRKNVVGQLTANNKYLSCPLDYLSTYSIAVVDQAGSYSYLLNKDVNFIREAYPSPTDTGTPKYYALFGTQYNNNNELTFILGPTPDSALQVEMHYFYYPESIVQASINAASIINQGSGYQDGAYPDIVLRGGTGFTAEVDIIISGGRVIDFKLITPGYYYAVGDILTINSADVGGIGSGFQLQVDEINNLFGQSWLGDNYDPVLFYGAMREAMLYMKGEADLVKYYEDKYQEALQQLRRLGDGLERGDAYRDGQLKLNTAPRGGVIG